MPPLGKLPPLLVPPPGAIRQLLGCRVSSLGPHLAIGVDRDRIVGHQLRGVDRDTAADAHDGVNCIPLANHPVIHHGVDFFRCDRKANLVRKQVVVQPIRFIDSAAIGFANARWPAVAPQVPEAASDAPNCKNVRRFMV